MAAATAAMPLSRYSLNLKKFRRAFRHSLLRHSSPMIFGNLSITTTIFGWLLTIHRSLNVELSAGPSMTVLHVSMDGVFVTFAPPQKQLGKIAWLETRKA